jgi:hypothetical protein
VRAGFEAEVLEVVAERGAVRVHRTTRSTTFPLAVQEGGRFQFRPGQHDTFERAGHADGGFRQRVRDRGEQQHGRRGAKEVGDWRAVHHVVPAPKYEE